MHGQRICSGRRWPLYWREWMWTVNDTAKCNTIVLVCVEHRFIVVQAVGARRRCILYRQCTRVCRIHLPRAHVFEQWQCFIGRKCIVFIFPLVYWMQLHFEAADVVSCRLLLVLLLFLLLLQFGAYWHSATVRSCGNVKHGADALLLLTFSSFAVAQMNECAFNW